MKENKKSHSVSLVLAVYKEDLSWLEKITNPDVEIILINKGIHTSHPRAKCITIENIGVCDNSYSYYFSTFYDELSDFTILSQGNPFDHYSNMIEFINNKEYLNGYTPLADLRIHIPRGEGTTIFVENILDYHFPGIHFPAGAQYCVTRDIIHSRPKVFWDNIYYKLCWREDSFIPYFMERMWHLLFNPQIPLRNGYENSAYFNIKPKVSVFGASGFIGGRFCDMYNDRVLKMDRDDYVSKTNQILYFISTIDNYNVHSNLHIDIDTNLSVLMDVLGKIDKNDKNLVFNFVSSWFVYGKNETMPFNEETSICNPTGFYSITKRCAEQLLISFCETFDIKYRIFRLANVLGEGDLKISKKKNAAQFLIRQVVNNEDVELYNGGTAIRDYIYVDDVCKAILHCMDNAPVNEIINIGNGKPYKLIDIVEEAIIQSNSVSNINKITPPHFHKVVQVENSYLDISKLKSYGFESETDMNEIINKLIKHYQAIMIDDYVKKYLE